ncbi:unnamed protein product [Eruca vesicaria subsp. sativa]|uniref:Uncharacterized protein n=1 Tax=Eruca vesicaria subsp. sativa TaxID=29727 RepID=A0ABC8JYZ2_ERUVS|nr:unnamed protein product [Eruca vesicaria subsp. sativa]
MSTSPFLSAYLSLRIYSYLTLFHSLGMFFLFFSDLFSMYLHAREISVHVSPSPLQALSMVEESKGEDGQWSDVVMAEEERTWFLMVDAHHICLLGGGKRHHIG